MRRTLFKGIFHYQKVQDSIKKEVENYESITVYGASILNTISYMMNQLMKRMEQSPGDHIFKLAFDLILELAELGAIPEAKEAIECLI